MNQIGTIIGSNNAHIGNVLPITCSISKTSPTEWILDLGATDHVTTSFHLFSFCKKINPVIVKLPIGHSIIITHADTVRFSQSLYLEDVLYILSFQFNLISISKLLSSLPCKLTFMNNKYFIQDM